LAYSCKGLRAFPQIPKAETLLNKTKREREREREREGQPERSTIARPWRESYPREQTPLECQMVMVTFIGRLSQFGTTYTNLR
jgi:hypothetical protein